MAHILQSNQLFISTRDDSHHQPAQTKLNEWLKSTTTCVQKHKRDIGRHRYRILAQNRTAFAQIQVIVKIEPCTYQIHAPERN